MGDRDYRHRDMVDKLGVKPGHAVAFDGGAGEIDPALRERVLARAGRPWAEADGEPVGIVLAMVDEGTDAAKMLARWKARLAPAGGIWLLSPKRG